MGGACMTAESKKYPKPSSFVIGLLSHQPNSREDLKAEMERKGYAAPTISSQFYNLNHWKGCVVEKGADGTTYRLSDDYTPEEKTEKPKKERKAKVAKAVGVPKPSKKRKKAA